MHLHLGQSAEDFFFGAALGDSLFCAFIFGFFIASQPRVSIRKQWDISRSRRTLKLYIRRLLRLKKLYLTHRAYNLP